MCRGLECCPGELIYSIAYCVGAALPVLTSRGSSLAMLYARGTVNRSHEAVVEMPYAYFYFCLSISIPKRKPSCRGEGGGYSFKDFAVVRDVAKI